MELVISVFEQVMGGMILLGSATQTLVKFLPLIILAVLAYLIFSYRDDLFFRRIAASRIMELDKLSRPKLRLFMRFFMQWLGYEEMVDHGDLLADEEARWKKNKDKRENVDLLMQKEETCYAVLVEAKENGVGRAAFQKLESAMEKYNCTKGIIINIGYFNKFDQQEAAYGDIELWDREKIIKGLLSLQGIEDTRGHGFGFYFQDFWRWVWRGG